MAYQQKAVPVEAFQFTGPDEKGALPQNVFTLAANSYAYLGDGLKPLKVGDYVVTYPDRYPLILTAAQFDALYEAVPVEEVAE